MYICKARELYGEELDDGSESFRYLIGELKTDSDGKYVINGILINAETIIPIKLQLNDEQKKILIQECKKRLESFKYSLLDLLGCLNDCLKWGDKNFYLEAEENFNVCLRKLKEAKQIIEGIL